MRQLLAAILLTAALVWAHDPKLHKGNATSGVVASIAGDTFELKTATATVKVTLNEKTKFEHGSAAVDKTHLKTGDSVSVIGTKLPAGELVAKEVLLGVAHPHPPAKSASKPAAKSQK
jgi:hypothetical protein